MVVFNNIVNETKKILYISKDNDALNFNLIRSGDLISVRFIRLENEREMEMNFLGLCVNKNSKCFTLRNIVSGVVVEQNFYFLSPLIKSIAIIKYNSKLLKLRRSQFNHISNINSSLIKFNFSFSIKPFVVSQNPLKMFFTNNINNSYYIVL